MIERWLINRPSTSGKGLTDGSRWPPKRRGPAGLDMFPSPATRKKRGNKDSSNIKLGYKSTHMCEQWMQGANGLFLLCLASVR